MSPASFVLSALLLLPGTAISALPLSAGSDVSCSSDIHCQLNGVRRTVVLSTALLDPECEFNPEQQRFCRHTRHWGTHLDVIDFLDDLLGHIRNIQVTESFCRCDTACVH